MEMRVLGPLDVAVEGEPWTPSRPKRRALLAALALRANEPVRIDRLVELLWRDEPPPTAATALHGHVSALRKQLPDGVLVTRPSAYELRVGPGELDADRFEELCAQGRHGSPERRAEVLREALALWRGQPFLDLVDDPDSQVEVARLEELRAEAIEERVAADLELGRHAELVAELEALVEAEPYRERLRGQLMLALYRCGRQTDALATYREARERLVEELGLEPGAELRRLEQQILRHDPALDLAAGDAPSLPLPDGPLVGRGEELAEARRLLDDGVRLLTVTGFGGIGKTRFALALAASLDRPRHGAFLVPLSAVGSPGDVAAAIAETLDVPVEGDALQRELAGRETLLVLDGFEPVLAAAPLLRQLLSAAPGLRLLVTSRVPLRLGGEQELHLGPLPAADALALLRERTRSVRRETEDGDAAAEICRRLEGVPLAIELAASRLRHFPPAVLLSRLDRSLDVLTRGPVDLPERQRTLRATIEWSYRLLDPEAQALLDRLSVFSGGWTLEQAEQVCGGADSSAVADGLALLVDSSLVEVGAGRYGMHDAVRQFAAERLEERGETERTRAAHRESLLALVQSERPIVTLGRGALGPERENLRAALRHALEAGDDEDALTFAHRLWRYWAESGAVSEARHWLEAALAAAAQTGSVLEGRCLDAAAFLASLQGETARAAALSEEAVRLLAAHPEAERAYAWALFRRGLIDVAAGRLEEALGWLERAAERFAAVGYPDGEAWTLLELHRRTLLLGEPEAAADGLAEARRAARRSAEHAVRPYAQTLYGSALALAGRPVQALPHVEHGLEQLVGLGAGFTLATALVHAAPALAAAGDVAGERRALAHALKICRDAAIVPDLVPALEAAGRSLARAGEAVAAARLWGAVDAACAAAGTPLAPLWTALRLADEEPVAAALAGGLDAERARGAALGLDGALELALAGLA